MDNRNPIDIGNENVKKHSPTSILHLLDCEKTELPTDIYDSFLTIQNVQNSQNQHLAEVLEPLNLMANLDLVDFAKTKSSPTVQTNYSPIPFRY